MGFVNYVASKMCNVIQKEHKLHTRWYGSSSYDRRVLAPTSLANDLKLKDKRVSPLLYILGLRSVSMEELNELDISRSKLISTSRSSGEEYTKKFLIKMLIHKAHKGSKFNKKIFRKNYKDTMKLYDAMLGVTNRYDEKGVDGHAIYEYDNFPGGEEGIDSNTTIAMIGVGQGAASQDILHGKKMKALVTVSEEDPLKWVRVDSRDESSWYSDYSLNNDIFPKLI